MTSLLTRLTCVGQLLMLSGVAAGGIVLQDGFDGGTYDPLIYEATGSATLEVLGKCDDRSTCTPGGDPCADGSECDYKLVVHVGSDTDSGVRINMPTSEGVGDAACLRISQDIDPAEFPVGSTYRHTIVMVNEDDPSIETGMQLQALRPAWNRCLYILSNRTSGDPVGEVRVFTPTKGDTTKFQCPGAKDVVFDWVPDKVCKFTLDPLTMGFLACTEDADCDEGDKCATQIQAEVTSKEAQAELDKFACLFQKPSCLDHGGAGPNAFRITAWTITGGESTGED